MATDKDVILNALQKERDDLHEKIMQIDRIMGRVRSLDNADNGLNEPVKQLVSPTNKPVTPLKLLATNTKDIKVLVIRVFDIIGKASALKDLQYEYFRMTGSSYPIREVVRSLNKSKVLLMVRIKYSHRGVLWARASWVQDGKLLDDYKPDGFDDLYKENELIYE
jgi:hypothetical protein